MVSERRQEALNVRIDPVVYRAVKMLAAVSGRRLNDIAEEALRQWVDAQPLTIEVRRDV